MKLYFKARSKILFENMSAFNEEIMEKFYGNLLQLWNLILAGRLLMFKLKSSERKICYLLIIFTSLIIVSIMFISRWVPPYILLIFLSYFISRWFPDASQRTKGRMDWNRHWSSFFEYSKHQLIHRTVRMGAFWLTKWVKVDSSQSTA